MASINAHYHLFTITDEAFRELLEILEREPVVSEDLKRLFNRKTIFEEEA